MKLSVSCEGEPKEIVTLMDSLSNDADNKKKVIESVRNQVTVAFERAAVLQAAREKSEQQQ